VVVDPTDGFLGALDPSDVDALTAWGQPRRFRCHRLVELAERFGERTGDAFRITLPLSQQELAGWTGASREAVSKALYQLRSPGYIETARRGITVLDIAALRKRPT
jgi:hypothetical protein